MKTIILGIIEIDGHAAYADRHTEYAGLWPDIDQARRDLSSVYDIYNPIEADGSATLFEGFADRYKAISYWQGESDKPGTGLLCLYEINVDSLPGLNMHIGAGI